jgi:hypothetical protein
MQIETKILAILGILVISLSAGKAWGEESCDVGPQPLSMSRGIIDDTSILQGILAPPQVKLLGQDAALYFLHVKLPAGSSAGWHCHSGPMFVCVEQGVFMHLEVIDKKGNYAPITLNPGQCTVEEALQVNYTANTDTDCLHSSGTGTETNSHDLIINLMPLAPVGTPGFDEFFKSVSGPLDDCPFE